MYLLWSPLWRRKSTTLQSRYRDDHYKLKPIEQFLKKHKLLLYCGPQNLFISMKSHSRPFLNTKRAREVRHLTRFKRDYQNTKTQKKNMLLVHYLVKRIASTHSINFHDMSSHYCCNIFPNLKFRFECDWMIYDRWSLSCRSKKQKVWMTINDLRRTEQHE
ncbi:hypothetical protein LOAG_05215 [Loa loa]|uniref:Uncharacterized protein n=1 Tax=Loa loa TaxID=7209 RepID=A0A1S0U081_LOALO|nr:hypothetical protein LOAG_05215 [Loa loa]EFO23271.1 hypothetical protein LOAG_05215 [Loa loa]